MSGPPPEEDDGIYIICFVCEQLERWAKHKSGEPVLVTQKRTGEHEQYFRLASVGRNFRRMLESALVKGFGKESALSWAPHVVLVLNHRTPHPVVVDPLSTPEDLELVPNRKLDIPYKLSLLPRPNLPHGVLIPPASVLRRLVISPGEPIDEEIQPWPEAEQASPESQPPKEPAAAAEAYEPQQQEPVADLLLGGASPVSSAAEPPDDLDSLLM